MRTMPRHYPGSARGDYRRACDICGIVWHRSSMQRRADGMFYCVDCQPEIDKVTLAELQEQNTAETISAARED